MKYVIEIEDEPFGRNDNPVIPYGMDELYKAKGFNSLVFDQSGLDKLTPLEKELEEAYQRGLDDGKARNENGCVGCRYDNGRIDHSPCDYCCNAYSNQWMAKEKPDEIKVGDRVVDNSNAIKEDAGVITHIKKNSDSVYVMWKDGSSGIRDKNEITKTGEHTNSVEELLAEMKGGAE